VSHPKISVVIPVFNCEKYVAEAIRSALTQSRCPDEVIVVDDGSTDTTAEVLRGFGDTICCIRQENQGIGAARNAGAARAAGDQIAFLDADDIWTPRKLELQESLLCDHSEIQMVFGMVEHFCSPELSDEIRQRFHCPVGKMPAINAASMLVRRSVFEKVGWFDMDLTLGEFLEWYARALDLGMQSRTLDEVVLRRRIHETNTGTRSRDSRQDYVRLLKSMLDRRRTSGKM
jgi:glycosyltransferase involved in cell wall biosynthesis